MPKILVGISSVVVCTAKNAEDMEKSGGVMAHADLCFGSGREHAIKYIRIRKMQGPTPGVTAHVPKAAVMIDGHIVYKPVLTGQAEQEAKHEALVAFDRIKQQFGIKFNKTYVVNAKEVTEVAE